MLKVQGWYILEIYLNFWLIFVDIYLIWIDYSSPNNSNNKGL